MENYVLRGNSRYTWECAMGFLLIILVIHLPAMGRLNENLGRSAQQDHHRLYGLT
jgi:hypothetical protein